MRPFTIINRYRPIQNEFVEDNIKMDFLTFNNSFRKSFAKIFVIIGFLITGFSPSAKSQEPQTENLVFADVTQGCTPLKVTFSHSIVNASQTHWNFGDGTVSEIPSPVHIYHQPGTYSVSLIYLNNDGVKDSVIKLAMIRVNENPIADFSLVKTGGCINDNQVTLHNLSRNAINFVWDMGDGSTLNGNEPAYQYSKTGIFDITLVASDNLGCNSFKTIPSAVEINPAPNADFLVSPLNACDISKPFNLNPQNENEASYLWDFGDGTVSIESQPIKYYSAPGTFLINLVVTNSFNCRTENQTPKSINISSPIIPEITADVTIGCEPLNIIFSSNTLNVNQWEWNFECVDTILGNYINHNYDAAGLYDISLTVIDSNGCRFTKIFSDYINVIPTPKADFQTHLLQSCLPVQAQFTNTSIGATKFHWDFGDGSISTEMNPSHTYSNPGSYSVSLVAENEQGCTSEFTQSSPLYVSSGNFDYQVPPVSAGCVPLQISFSYNKEGVTNWLWDFGDGSTSQSATPSQTYSEAGDYTVSLSLILNGGCTFQIPVFSSYHVSGTKADFTINNKNDCPPYSADFTNLAENVISWFWDFGDSTYSNETNPHHPYSQSGYYNVSLEVTSADGCKHSLQKTNAIYFEPLDADFYMTVIDGSYPKRVEFISVTSGNVSFEWDFGDGTYSAEKDPVHFYYQEGTYSVTLKIINAKGCEKTIMYILGPIEMGVGGVFGNLNAEFSTEEGKLVLGCAPREVHFINESSGAVSWNWNFGDGSSSSEKNPEHTYLFPGNYTVTMIAKNPSGFSDTIFYPDFVKITGPLADYSFSYPTLCEMNKVAFNNTPDTSLANGLLQYEWNFGDSTYSFEKNPIHTFPSYADYQTMLTITDENGCLSNKTSVIETGDIYKISASLNSGCKPLKIKFDFVKGSFSGYQWNFGDGNSDTTSNPEHLFTNIGNFIVFVELTDSNNCKRTINFLDTIHVFGPKADFSIQTKDSGCDSLQVVFQNNSTGADSYLWLFGDGSQSSEFSPSHLYKNEGKMTVSLIASGQGCTDTSKIPEAVQIGKPESSFRMDGFKGCLPFPVSFQNTSLNSEKYLWDFGDGSFSEEKSPVHLFSSRDTFLVNLISWSFNGCPDTFHLNTPVIVRGPEAKFVSNENNNCPPALFSFTDRSNGAEIYEWNFGDGSFSGLENPSHIYTKSGYYDIRLVITDNSGCSDTLIKPDFIHVQGPVVSFETSVNVSCGPAEVKFLNQTNEANDFFWSFGDGKSDSIFNTGNFYAETGEYVITLIASDTLIGCSDFYTDTIRINEIPVAGFSSTLICDRELQFLNTTLATKPLWKYSWDFGDGSHSEETAVLHKFVNYGEYRISLTVQTPEGCSDTNIDTLVIEPVNMINFSVSNVCEGVPVQFIEEVNPAYENLIAKRNWIFGDGSTSNGMNPNHIYSNSGAYNILLSVESESGCIDTILKNISVNTTPEPVIITETICENRETSIKGDAGKDNEEIETWKWSFGNSETSTGRNISKIFETTGEMNVTLIAETQNHCLAKTEATILINPTPVADFYMVKQEICGPEKIVFENRSYGINNETKYFWSFGDGKTSEDKLPVHSYNEPGNYIVTLMAQNASGCTSLFMAEKGLNVNPMPEARFTVKGEPTSRNPQVELINTGFSYSTSGWDFGDGATSEETNPLHLYADTGNFLITLRVTGAGGCSDAASEWIHVKPYATLFMPNAFTPDNDGLNDIFKPAGNGLILNFSFQIYDRWGKKLFESNDFDFGWDGNFKGSPVPLGVYTWMITGRTVQQNDLVSSGTVTVLR